MNCSLPCGFGDADLEQAVGLGGYRMVLGLNLETAARKLGKYNDGRHLKEQDNPNVYSGNMRGFEDKRWC